MKTTKIRFLQNTLKRYSRMFRERSNTAIVELVVENGWEAQNLWLVRNLVIALFPVKHPDELPWYDIVPGSVVMTFITFEHMTSSLIESSRKKTKFMGSLGVISLKIGSDIVWKRESESKVPFSFENSLIQAVLAHNIEAVQFLLQHATVNVNIKNTTNALVEKEVYWSQESVEILLRKYHATFDTLLRDVEYEFQYVQGLVTAYHNNLNSNSLVADGVSKSTYCPRDNFLNGRVLAALSNQLPEDLSIRVKRYHAAIDEVLMRKSLLIHLSSLLEEYFPTPFTNSVEIVLTLHNAWSSCSIWYAEQLGKLIFTPTLFHNLQWFTVGTRVESLRVVLLADKKLMDNLTKECLSNKDPVAPLLGVVSVQIDDTVVISNDYSNGYTFNEALELAKAMGNDEVADRLLQIHQSPVDFIRLQEPDNNSNHRFLPEHDSTPLMIACCSDNNQLVQLLLDHNANPNIHSRQGYTALMYSTGNTKIFQMVLDREADIKAYSFSNETVLYYACRAGNVKVVKTILATSHELVHVATNDGRTPLKEAIRYGYTDIVGILLQAKADPNIRDDEGWTALRSASHYGNSKIVKTLLQAKADPNIRDNNGWTALQSASLYAHTEIVGMLLEAKADPNIPNNSRWTALASASRYGHTEIVKMLLQAKANPNIQNDKGWTALQSASRFGHTKIATMLLQAKANPNIHDNKGWTALRIASRCCHTEIVEMLLQARADPNKQDNKGLTALQLASIHGHREIVGMLLLAKADPNIKNDEGWTALASASRFCHTDIVRMLLQSKADPNIQDNEGRTALHLTISEGHANIARTLLQGNANPKLETHRGLTALDLALEYGHISIINELCSILSD